MKNSAGIKDSEWVEINLKGHHSCHQVAAYWVAPPSWPRRVFCDIWPNLCGIFSDTRYWWTAVAVLVVTYLAIMDVILYSYFQRSNLVHDSKKGGAEELYSPFTHLSVKALMLDEPGQFLKTPSAEYFNTVTRLSSAFPFITPNVISVTHLLCGFAAGKFIASSVLNDRRIGVALFCFRNWLDALDGTVFRAQSHTRLQFRSVPKTSGYFIDVSFDTLGGCFLCFGILFHLIKRFRPKRYHLLPLWCRRWRNPVASPAASSSSSTTTTTTTTAITSTINYSHSNSNGQNGVQNGCSTGAKYLKDKVDFRDLSESEGEEDGYTVAYLFTKILTLGLCLALAGMGWNNSMQGLTDVFQTEIQDENLSLLQFQHCHSLGTVALFMAWRLLGSLAMVNYVMLAVFFDYIWEFMHGPHVILLGLTSVLLCLSQLYINHLKNVLQL